MLQNDDRGILHALVGRYMFINVYWFQLNGERGYNDAIEEVSIHCIN